jgi:hypothetical protein
METQISCVADKYFRETVCNTIWDRNEVTLPDGKQWQSKQKWSSRSPNTWRVSQVSNVWVVCLLWINEAKAKDKTYIWVSVCFQPGWWHRPKVSDLSSWFRQIPDSLGVYVYQKVYDFLWHHRQEHVDYEWTLYKYSQTREANGKISFSSRPVRLLFGFACRLGCQWGLPSSLYADSSTLDFSLSSNRPSFLSLIFSSRFLDS